jgi:hypothetical protein
VEFLPAQEPRFFVRCRFSAVGHDGVTYRPPLRWTREPSRETPRSCRSCGADSSRRACSGTP